MPVTPRMRGAAGGGGSPHAKSRKEDAKAAATGAEHAERSMSAQANHYDINALNMIYGRWYAHILGSDERPPARRLVERGPLLTPSRKSRPAQ